MSKFKVTDHVRVTIEGCWSDKTGVVAEIQPDLPYPVFVDLDKGGQVAFTEHELILADVVEAPSFEWINAIVKDMAEREIGREYASGLGCAAEAVEHPAHYGGDTTYETIRVIEAWGLGFGIGNAVKYLSRAGKKGAAVEDLKKARFYIQREIDRMESDA